jgi:phosphosulfolactate phosphohydrolase-like enzyme
MAGKTVRIDALAESAWRYRDYDAVVCIDVLLAGTTVVTAAAQGRPTFMAATAQEALVQGSRFDRAVLAADFGAPCPSGFEAIGPAFLHDDAERTRPIVLLSDTARLMANAAGASAVYVASLRNLEATAEHLSVWHQRVAVLGAGEAGEVRCEDQMAAVWLAALLEARGFSIEDRSSAVELARWRSADVSLVGWGRSAERLREAGRQRDVELVLNGFDDLDAVFGYSDGEVRALPAARRVQTRDAVASGTFG